MFTDMVGYTALGQRNESLSLALVDEQRRVIRPILARHHGREVKTIGDAFLVEFANAVDAVRCAYDIQRSIREFNLSLAPDKRIHLRVGVHVGEVVEYQGDISGDAVNVASRIEPLAEDGGVCVTRQVYDFVRSKVDIPLSSLGPKSLKNVAEPMEVFRMAMPWEKDAEGAERHTSPRLDPRRIAVLPLVSMSPDPNDEYFADGMTEEVISTISHIEGVEVISRTSAMQYKKTPKPIRDVSKELDVGTVLEGSIRKAGNRIRVTFQMIDAMRDRHVWAENYDRDLKDVFEIQSEIASKVAQALQTKMPAASTALPGPPTKAETYTTYLRASQLLHEGTEAGLRESAELFRRATAEDPGFAPAYVGLANAWATLSLGFEDFETSVTKADAAARRALEIAPGSAEAHAVVARVCSLQDRFAEELAEAEAAIRINPSLSEGYRSLGMHYATEGSLAEACQAYRKAHELDPLMRLYYYPIVAQVIGEEKEALVVLDRWQSVYPNRAWVYDSFALFYILKGDYSKGQEAVTEGLRLEPSDAGLRADQGMIYAFTGKRAEAERMLQEISEEKVESARLYCQILVQASLGNLDGAFKALDRQAETRSWHALMLTFPIFAEMRKDPRFQEFVSKVGISPKT